LAAFGSGPMHPQPNHRPAFQAYWLLRDAQTGRIASTSKRESRYNLTLVEQRLIFTMIARIQPEDEDFKPYHISLHELADFLGINKNHIYADCKNITKNC